MSLKIQIISLVVSFIYGIFTFFVYNSVSRFLFSTKIVNKIISNFVFVLFMTLLYFFIMVKINYAVIHPYFLGVFAVGFLLSRYIYFRIRDLKH